MKAIQVRAFGGPENLTLQELPPPKPKTGQVLIAVEAIGVGLVDVLLRRGLNPAALSTEGFIPGAEVAGTVLAVGEGVDRSWVERRVFAPLEMGGYAERVAVDVDALVPIPSGLSSAEAMALGVNALVAWFALRRALLKAGERVLVRGASGGIGLMATQLAALDGATVSVATSSAERGQRLLRLGASRVLDRAARSADAPPESFDIIIDPVAGPEMSSLFGRLQENGRMVVCGIAGGFPPPDFGMGLLGVFRKSLTLATFSLDTIGAKERATAMKELFERAARGELKPVIHDTLPLSSASLAHARLEAGEVFGKMVLAPEAT